ncbi:MAG: NUDIX-like domain-containing protein [Polyangiales bacterium]
MSADAVEVFPGEAAGFARGCEPVPDPLPERARWCVTRGDAVVLASGPDGDLLPTSLSALGLAPTTIHHLGALEGDALFAVELPNGHPLPAGFTVVGLRALAERVDPSTWAACAFATQVVTGTAPPATAASAAGRRLSATRASARSTARGATTRCGRGCRPA